MPVLGTPKKSQVVNSQLLAIFSFNPCQRGVNQLRISGFQPISTNLMRVEPTKIKFLKLILLSRILLTLMNGNITIKEEDRCYTFSADQKSLIKYHWHSGKVMRLPETIESIKPFALANFKHISAIYMPMNINTIGRGALYECTSLRTVIFLHDEHEVTIEKQAFGKCHSLENINLPNFITSIPEGCFEDCFSLQLLILPSELLRLEKTLSKVVRI